MTGLCNDQFAKSFCVLDAGHDRAHVAVTVNGGRLIWGGSPSTIRYRPPTADPQRCPSRLHGLGQCVRERCHDGEHRTSNAGTFSWTSGEIRYQFPGKQSTVKICGRSVPGVGICVRVVGHPGQCYAYRSPETITATREDTDPMTTSEPVTFTFDPAPGEAPSPDTTRQQQCSARMASYRCQRPMFHRTEHCYGYPRRPGQVHLAWGYDFRDDPTPAAAQQPQNGEQPAPPAPVGLPVQPDETVDAAVWHVETMYGTGTVHRFGDDVQCHWIRDGGTWHHEVLTRTEALRTGEQIHRVAELLPRGQGQAVTDLLDLAAVYIAAARWGGVIPGCVTAAELCAGMVVRTWGPAGGRWVRIDQIGPADDHGVRDALVTNWEPRSGTSGALDGRPYPMAFPEYAGGYMTAPDETD